MPEERLGIGKNRGAMYANAKTDRLCLPQAGIAVASPAMKFKRACAGRTTIGKFKKTSVAALLDDAATEITDGLIHFAQNTANMVDRPLLVAFNEPHGLDDIHEDNCLLAVTQDFGLTDACHDYAPPA